MEGNSPYITNLVNSIIGVSVLAMPFCLKQCGIVLGLCLLFGAAWLTYISCSMLSNSAFYKRRRTYEYLALYTLGPTGKFTVELSMIGMMLGTCIAFYVVIGDLSNGILARFIDGADPHTLRVFTIIFCALCIALPLAMMKNLSVLSYFGFFSLTFYLGFVVVVILNAVSNGLLNWDWWWKVNLWRPAGIFQCLPIFSLAYACQCQLFIVYDSLEEPSVRRIEDIVSSAIKFVTVVYMCVGFFGYTTYSEHVAGNLLVSFPSNMLLDFIKLGFAMSVVLGFPLIIFPCRQSIHTLFFGKPVGEGLQPNTYIPPFLFKSITLMIVLSTMTVAIMIPNVETILGLTGATMGSIICFIFPALIYDKANPKGSGFVAKFVFVVGCLLLVVCTYSNLANTGANAVDESKTPIVHDEPKLPVIDTRDINKEPVVDKQVESDDKKIDKDKIDKVEDKDKPEAVAEVHDDEHRHEPPIPIDPDNPANGNDNIRSPEDNDPAQNKDEDEKKPVESEKTVEKVVEDPAVVKEDLVKQDSPKVEHNIQPSSEKRQEEERQHQPVVQSPVEKQHQEPVENEKEVVRESPKKEDIPVLKDSPQQVVEKPKSPAEKIQQQQPDHQQQREINQPKSPAKEENVQKQQPPPVQHQQPVLEIKSPLNDNKNEARQPDNQEVKQPDKDINRKNEDKRDISDQNEPVQPQQGSQENKEAPKPDAAVNQDSQEADPAQEKELLEKIKIQHDKQQQLLIEQEQLIKKLEEHQDKKEQAAEERPIANDSPNNIENRGKEEETVIKQAQQPIVGNVDNEPVAPVAPIGGIDTGNAMPDRNLIPEKRVLGGGGEKVMLGREILSDYDNTPQISLGVDQMPHNAERMPHGFDQVQHVNQVPFAVNQVPDSINQMPRRVDQIPHGIDQAANNINLEQGIVPQNHQRPQNVGSQKDALNENEEILLHEDNSKEKEPVRRQERALNEDSLKEMEKEENEDSETDNRQEDSKLEADPDLENSESELNYFSDSDNIEAKSIQVDQEIEDNLNDKLTLNEGNNLQESELSENKKNNLLTQNDEVDKVDKILQPRLDGGVENIEPPSPGLSDLDSDYDETAKVEAEKMISDCLENDEKCWQGKAKVRELKSLDQVDL